MRTQAEMSLFESWWSLTLTVVFGISALSVGISALRMADAAADNPNSPETGNMTAKAVEQAVYHDMPTWVSFLIDPVSVLLLFLLAGLIAAGIMYAKSR